MNSLLPIVLCATTVSLGGAVIFSYADDHPARAAVVATSPPLEVPAAAVELTGTLFPQASAPEEHVRARVAATVVPAIKAPVELECSRSVTLAQGNRSAQVCEPAGVAVDESAITTTNGYQHLRMRLSGPPETRTPVKRVTETLVYEVNPARDR